MKIYEAFKPGMLLADQYHGEPAKRVYCATKGQARKEARILNGGNRLDKKSTVQIIEHDLRGKPAFVTFINRVYLNAGVVPRNGNVMKPPLPPVFTPELPPEPPAAPLTGKTKTIARYVERIGNRKVHRKVKHLWKEAQHAAELELRWRKRNARRLVVMRKADGQIVYLRSIKRHGKIGTEPGVMWTARLIEARRFSRVLVLQKYLLRYGFVNPAQFKARPVSVSALTH